jgi:DNA-binding NarL/FixJ family response regulator
MISVLLADDHPLILRGLRGLLATETDIEVVGAETDPAAVPDAVVRLKPDVLIQDLSMGSTLTGLAVIRMVRECAPDTRIVVLSMHSTLATIAEVMSHGALGYVSKLADPQQLVAAVRTVHGGKRHVGGPFTGEQIEAYARDAKHGAGRPLNVLTPREIEVLILVAHGRTSSEIGEALQIGRRTVESHRASVSSKLGARTQAALVRYAIERGLVSPN